MQQDHLRSVPGTAGVNGSSGSTPTKARAKSRPRARKALPTDRLKFHMQVAALKAVAVSSSYGKEAVTAEAIAPKLGVVSATAGLNNAFFMESGLIDRESKGHYKPTEAVNRFARKHSFDAAEAGRELAETLSRTWYFGAVKQQLDMGTVTKRRMIQVLADAAGASKDHQIQLLALLAWLEYAGLITTEGGSVQIATDAPVETPLVDPPPDENATRPADPAGEGTTTEGGRHDPQAKSEVEAEAALSFDFHLALTVDDLRRLSPDQIQALFAAVGTVMSIKTTI